MFSKNTAKIPQKYIQLRESVSVFFLTKWVFVQANKKTVRLGGKYLKFYRRVQTKQKKVN